MRFLSIICGTLVLLGALSLAQEPSLQDGPHHTRLPRRAVQPQPAGVPGSSDPLPAQNASPSPPQQFAVPPPQNTQQPAIRAPQNQTVAVPDPASVAQPLPEQLPPPTPPQVTYRNGMLTVQAMNSTLAGLLTAIRNKTGIQFEGLEGGANERVAVSMGPAPEGEVLTAILGGSNFDFVVLDRQDSPGTVQRVLLTPRGGSSTAAGTQPTRTAFSQTQGDDEDVQDAAASGGDPEQPQDTPARPPLTQAQQSQPQQPTSPKTPEQLLEELRRMQQQQQQQPGQNPAPNKPPLVPQ
jgi:hypothetical protein